MDDNAGCRSDAGVRSAGRRVSPWASSTRSAPPRAHAATRRTPPPSGRTAAASSPCWPTAWVGTPAGRWRARLPARRFWRGMRRRRVTSGPPCRALGMPMPPSPARRPEAGLARHGLYARRRQPSRPDRHSTGSAWATVRSIWCAGRDRPPQRGPLAGARDRPAGGAGPHQLGGRRTDPRRHVLRSALTGTEIEMIDRPRAPLALEPGDVVVLASDGIHSLAEAEIARIAAAAGTPAAAAEALLAAVAAAGDPHRTTPRWWWCGSCRTRRDIRQSGFGSRASGQSVAIKG